MGTYSTSPTVYWTASLFCELRERISLAAFFSVEADQPVGMVAALWPKFFGSVPDGAVVAASWPEFLVVVKYVAG